MKHLTLLLLGFLCAFYSASQSSEVRDSRLMTEAEYKNFLTEVEAKLPGWEAALKRIDPASTNASYAVG
jgi:hypothetical protein